MRDFCMRQINTRGPTRKTIAEGTFDTQALWNVTQCRLASYRCFGRLYLLHLRVSHSWTAWPWRWRHYSTSKRRY